MSMKQLMQWSDSYNYQHDMTNNQTTATKIAIREKEARFHSFTHSAMVICVNRLFAWLWSGEQLSVNTKTVHFWKILLAQAERAY